jgi:serine/threonine-protein kinase RIO1
MNEENSRKSREHRPQDTCPADSRTDPFIHEVPSGMTLEGIIDLTDELAHLNELVLLHVESAGGFTCPSSYFTIVTPLLDMLEVEIRFRYRAGMSKDQMKLIVQDWIDKEIADLKGRRPASVPVPDPEEYR